MCSFSCIFDSYPNDEKELDRQDLEHRNQLIQMRRTRSRQTTPKHMLTVCLNTQKANYSSAH